MKLIIIDDCDTTISTMKIYMRKIKSYHPHINPYYFKTAEEALEEIKLNNVSLIVCDMNLGGPHQMDAFDLSDRIVAEMDGRQYPFLVVSSSDIDGEEAEEKGLYFMDKADIPSKFTDYCIRTLTQHKTHTSICHLQDELKEHKKQSQDQHLVVIESLKQIHAEQKRTTKERIGAFITSFFPKPLKAITDDKKGN